jgi:hypothetical protein
MKYGGGRLCIDRLYVCSDRRHTCIDRRWLCRGRLCLCEGRGCVCVGRLCFCGGRGYVCVDRHGLCGSCLYVCLNFGVISRNEASASFTHNLRLLPLLLFFSFEFGCGKQKRNLKYYYQIPNQSLTTFY